MSEKEATPLDIDKLQQKVHCLRLELPKAVADDVLPELHDALDGLKKLLEAAKESLVAMDNSSACSFKADKLRAAIAASEEGRDAD